MRAFTLVTAWLLAVIVAAALGSIVQTQFNLGALQALGVPMPWDLRLITTARDLAGFTPLFGALVAAGFLIAFLATGLLRRWLRNGRTALYALAGAVAIAAILLIMTAAFGMVPIAAARGLGGFVALALCGAAGGVLFARLTAARR